MSAVRDSKLFVTSPAVIKILDGPEKDVETKKELEAGGKLIQMSIEAGGQSRTCRLQLPGRLLS
jgi:hypothetical protein